jgi:uncharacterized protein
VARTPRGLLALDLAATNPWWRGGNWQAEDPQLAAAGAAPFDYRPTVLDDIVPPNLYTLRGPRRVGKTTVLKQCIARLAASPHVDPRQIVYIAADTCRSRIDLQNVIRTAHATFPTLGNRPRYLFVDEITAVADWHVAVKWLRDNSAVSQDCLVVTGSSAGAVAAGTESLAGRRGPDVGLDRLLLPMPFPEFVRCAGFALPAPARLRLLDFFTEAGRTICRDHCLHLNTLLVAYEQYLAVGGFPQAVAGLVRQGTAPAGFARDLWDVVQADLRRAGVSRPETCLRLVERLVHYTCSTISFRTLGAELDVDPRTAQAWVEALANSYLAFLLFREDDGVPDVNKLRKAYLADPAFAFLPRQAAPGAAEPDPTQLAESALALALLRTTERGVADRFNRPQGLYYFVSRNGAEIDFLVHPARKVADSKYVDVPDHREARAMLDNFGEALLLTRTAVDFERPGSTVLPAPVFCWLLSQPV